MPFDDHPLARLQPRLDHEIARECLAGLDPSLLDLVLAVDHQHV